jgi:hypothetical protein
VKTRALFWIAAIALAEISCQGWTGIPGKPYAGWPKAVKEMTSSTTTYGHFRIHIVEAADQAAGGTGGAVWDVDVKNIRTGKTLRIETQSVGTRVLEIYNGYPQIEIWGNGGGGTYSRVLYRVEHEVYCPIRDDLFDRNPDRAVRKDVTAIRPGGEATLYYTDTMYPEPGSQ